MERTLLAMALICVPGSVRPQPAKLPPTTTAAPDASVPGSELTVYLMTMGPGDEVWEKFGHNAIWIHDGLRNTDVAYNWGLFDFAGADFLPRFLKGDMRYWMGGFDQKATVDSYRKSNRTVVAQELNLTPSQRESLARFVEWNARPENRFYHYDYFRDNCSTRVRDALDAAFGGVIKRELDGPLSGFTYRSETQRLTQDDWPAYVGTLLGLGQPVDHRLTGWDLGFLPGRLSESLRDVRVTDAKGQPEPVVKSERILFLATRAPEAAAPSSKLIGLLLLGGTLLGLFLTLAGETSTSGGLARLAFFGSAALWSLVVGVGGTALVGLWTLTNHVYSYHNENLFQANPLSLILAVLILSSLKTRGRSAGYRHLAGARTARLAWAIAILSIMGLVLKILPGFYQENAEIIALTLPAHLGLAVALSRRAGWLSRIRLRRIPVPQS